MYLKLKYALFSADFDSRYVGKKNAGNLNLSAGVTYNIFGQHFKKQSRGASMPNIVYKEVIKMVHDTIVQQQVITVNDTIYLTETMDVPMPKSRIDTVFLNTTPQTIDFVNAALGYILFNIGSDKPSESVTLQCINTAHYLNENPGQTITLYGYADKETGTPEVNMQVAKRRVNYVKQLLIEKYGIAPNRIKTDALGSNAQLYDQAVLNRLVVIQINK